MARGRSTRKPFADRGNRRTESANSAPQTRAKAKVGRYASTKRGNCDDDGSGHRALENIPNDHHNDEKKSDDDDGSDERSVDSLEGGGVNKRNDLVPRTPFQLILDNVEQATSCITAEEDPTHLINSLSEFPYIQKALWGLQWATEEDAGSLCVAECYNELNWLLEDLRAEFKMEVLEGSAVNRRNGGNEEEESSDDERCGGGQKSFVANRGKKKDEIKLVGEPPRAPKKKSNKSTDDSIVDNVTQKCTAKSTPPVSSTEVTSTSMRSYPYEREITLINPSGTVKGTRMVTIKRQSHDPDAKPDEKWIESVVLALLAKGGEKAMNFACAFLYWIDRDLATVLEQRMCKGHGVNQSEFRTHVGLNPKDFAYYLCSLLPDSQSAAMLLLASLQGDHLNPKDELFLRYNRGFNGKRGKSHHSNFVPLSRYLNRAKGNHSVMNNTMLPISVAGQVMTPDQFDSEETTAREQFSHWHRIDIASLGSFDNYDEESFEEGGDRTKEAVLADLEKSTNKLKELEEEIKKVQLEAMGFRQELHRIDPSMMSVDARLYSYLLASVLHSQQKQIGMCLER